MNANILSQTTVHLLFCGFMVVLLVAKGWGEFHKRDHTDVTRPLQPIFKVDSTEDEVFYLEKFGYLKDCILPTRRKRDLDSRRKRDLDFRTAIITDTEGETREGKAIRYCTHSEIVRATMKMQAWFKLPQTGVFDSKTVAVMNMQRCGNPDISSELEKEIERRQRQVLSSNEVGPTREKRTIGGHTIEEGHPNDNHVYLDHTFVKNPEKEGKKVSKLYDLLTRSASQNKNTKDDIYFKGVSARRKKFLHSYMERATAKDIKKLSASEKTFNKLKKLFKIRVRRSTLVEAKNSVKFTQPEIRWRLIESAYSSYIAWQDQRRVIHLAWRMWSEVIPLKFIEDTQSDILAIDVELGFGTGKHMDCNKVFDGQGGEVAHSWAGGNVHIDDAENFHLVGGGGLDLLYVVLHEIGHVLSLNHSLIYNSIMFPTYRTDVEPAGLELGKVDRTKVQAVYGVCTGRFNTVFDILKWSNISKTYVYYTYFFRGNKFWMYENRYDRPRYGDPLRTTYEWNGFPDDVDAATQVLYQSRIPPFIENVLYIFKGDHYYKWDVYYNRVMKGYPKNISEGFPAKDSNSEPIPNDLDTVYYDWRNEHMYFIKDEWVYEYDITADPSEQGCCVSKKKFADVFPKATDSEGTELKNGVDAAYYSFKYDKVFFFKNETVYKNQNYTWKSRTISNSLAESGPWSDIWNDICDV